jgi:hypothetical protein
VKTTDELGPQIAIYRERPFQRRDLLVLFLPLGLAVLVPLGYGLYRAWYAYTQYVRRRSLEPPWYLFLASQASGPAIHLLYPLVRRLNARFINSACAGLIVQPLCAGSNRHY